MVDHRYRRDTTPVANKPHASRSLAATARALRRDTSQFLPTVRPSSIATASSRPYDARANDLFHLRHHFMLECAPLIAQIQSKFAGPDGNILRAGCS